MIYNFQESKLEFSHYLFPSIFLQFTWRFVERKKEGRSNPTTIISYNKAVNCIKKWMTRKRDPKLKILGSNLGKIQIMQWKSLDTIKQCHFFPSKTTQNDQQSPKILIITRMDLDKWIPKINDNWKPRLILWVEVKDISIKSVNYCDYTGTSKGMSKPRGWVS